VSAVYELLPPGGLDQSIVLAVLLGVWVTLLFTETLGWVFVGLVVPGYLASVLVVQPTTALVIVAEALLTYWLARGLAYGLAPTRVWTPFFGRDRFFLIVWRACWCASTTSCGCCRRCRCGSKGRWGWRCRRCASSTASGWCWCR
jgi:hypothetical protein